MEHITRAQVDTIHQDGCRVVDIAHTKDGNTVILYTDNGLHLFARIVHDSGGVTRRYINDLAMYVQQKRNENAYKIQYIRILGDKINHGYGSLMMRQLLKTAWENNIDYIDGRMQDAGTEEHESRLRHFYMKFGFRIDENRQLLWKRQDVLTDH